MQYRIEPNKHFKTVHDVQTYLEGKESLYTITASLKGLCITSSDVDLILNLSIYAKLKPTRNVAEWLIDAYELETFSRF